ncbi:MAG: glycosyltransferase family 4 protein [Cetobacterium sp.]
MNILFVLDNFPPDLGAASFRFESIVKSLADRGNNITILASLPNRISDVDINLDEFKYQNVKVIRVKNKKMGNNIFSRAMTYFLFFLSSMVTGIKLGQNCQIIIASTPQLFVGFSGAIISTFSRKKFILDIRDLWPDIVLDMGVMKKYNPIYLGLKFIEYLMYKKADFIVYNSPGFKLYLESKYDNEKIKLITNGIDDYILEYFEDKKFKVQAKEKYKLMYAGNLGIAQDIKILVEFSKNYRDKVEILLIGKGSQEDLIRKQIQREKIKNITLESSVPRKELLERYMEADILFLQLKDIKMFEKTIPSKIFEYLATKKPIIYGLEGIGKNILQNEFKRKYYFRANDLENLSEIFESLVQDIENNKFQEPDIEKLRKNYSRKVLSEKYINLINKISEQIKN